MAFFIAFMGAAFIAAFFIAFMAAIAVTRRFGRDLCEC